MNRKREKHVLLLLVGWIVVITVIGCTKRQKGPERRTFPAVTVPIIYADQQAQAEYLVKHYWDQFDFSDSVWVGSAEPVTEQALVNYLNILPYSSYDVICEGIKSLLDRADTNQAMYAYFSSRMEFYFSGQNATYRNDEFYIPVLEHMIASNSLDEPRKVRPNTLLPLLLKNRPNTQASDIRYTTVSGAKGSLYNVKSDYIMVVFYDFDCEDCNVLKKLIEESLIVNDMLKQRKLAIVAIYPGANMEGWKRSSSQVPAAWINGYDHNEEIANEGTYILRSIPTLFLLDRNYMVILKEPPFDYMEFYFDNILNPPSSP